MRHRSQAAHLSLSSDDSERTSSGKHASEEIPQIARGAGRPSLIRSMMRDASILADTGGGSRSPPFHCCRVGCSALNYPPLNLTIGIARACTITLIRSAGTG